MSAPPDAPRPGTHQTSHKTHSPLREGSAADVLARDPDVDPVLEQRAKRHRFGRREVDLALETLETGLDVTVQARVDVLYLF